MLFKAMQTLVGGAILDSSFVSLFCNVIIGFENFIFGKVRIFLSLCGEAFKPGQKLKLNENIDTRCPRTRAKDCSCESVNKLSEAKEIQDVTYKDLITIEEAFKNMDSIKISKDNTKKFINGVKFKYKETQIDLIKVYSEDNKFLGLGEVNKNYLKHKHLV